MTAGLHLYLEDTDAFYQQAIDAEAKSMYPRSNQDYGDRRAALVPFGNHWYYLATAKR